MEQKKISRNCGFKDVYIGEVLKNTPEEYEVDKENIYKLARAISGKITHKYESENLYSDDMLEDTVDQYVGTDVELNVNTLSNEDFYRIYNTLYDNGYLVKSSEDTAKEVALGFRAKRADGTYDFQWLYSGKFTDRPEENYETQEDKIKTQTATIKGSFKAREKTDDIDGKEKHLIGIKVNECELLKEHKEAKEAIKNWFKEVQEYKPGVTVPEDLKAKVNTTTNTQIDVTFTAPKNATTVKIMYSNDNGATWKEVATAGESDKISIPAPLTKDSVGCYISNFTAGTYKFKLVVDDMESNITEGVTVTI